MNSAWSWGAGAGCLPGDSLAVPPVRRGLEPKPRMLGAPPSFGRSEELERI